MQKCPENDCFQFMCNSMYGTFSLSGVFRSNSVVFFHNPMLLYLSPENFSIIKLLIRATILFLYPHPLPLQRRQSRRKQLFELRVNSSHLEQ